MNFLPFKIIFLNTIKREVRNNTLIFFLVLSILFIFGVNGAMDLFNNLMEDNLFKGVDLASKKMTVFYFIIHTWNLILSSFIGIGLIRTDYRDGIIDQILSFPVKRFEYLFARALGGTFIVFGYYLISIICAFFIFGIFSGAFSMNLNLLYSMFIGIFYIFGVISITMFVSLFFSRISGLIVLFLSYLFILKVGWDFSDMASMSMNFSTIIKGLFYYLVPRFGVMTAITVKAADGAGISSTDWWQMGHYILALGLCWVFLTISFNKKELR